VKISYVPGLKLGNISKPQAGLQWCMQWSKRDCKSWYWRTETKYEALSNGLDSTTYQRPKVNLR